MSKTDQLYSTLIEAEDAAHKMKFFKEQAEKSLDEIVTLEKKLIELKANHAKYKQKHEKYLDMLLNTLKRV